MACICPRAAGHCTTLSTYLGQVQKLSNMEVQKLSNIRRYKKRDLLTTAARRRPDTAIRPMADGGDQPIAPWQPDVGGAPASPPGGGQRMPAHQTPGSRLCPLPKRVSKRKSPRKAAENGGQHEAHTNGDVPGSIASPISVDVAPALSSNGAPPSLPSCSPSSVDALRTPPSLGLGNGMHPDPFAAFAKSASKLPDNRLSFSGGPAKGGAALSQHMETWHAERVKELVDGQRGQLVRALLAEGFEHDTETITSLLESFSDRRTGNTRFRV